MALPIMERKRSASGSCSRMAINTELSTTIIRSSPRLFENLSRRALIKKRPGGNAAGYLARAIDIGGFARRRALGNGDTGNTGFHLDPFL